MSVYDSSTTTLHDRAAARCMNRAAADLHPANLKIYDHFCTIRPTKDVILDRSRSAVVMF